MDWQGSDDAFAERKPGRARRQARPERRGIIGLSLGASAQSLLLGITDVARLAAAYASGIVRNHSFVDGNKRAAVLAIYVFVAKNGYRFVADKVDATRKIFALAAGDLGEEDLASWIRAHLAVAKTKNS